MPMTITYTFAPLQIIFASRFNQNFSDVKSWADTHELLNSSVHGITGTFVDTGTQNQVITAVKRADKLIQNIPNEASNTRIQILNGRLRVYGLDGNDPSITNPVTFTVPDAANPGLHKILSFTSITNTFLDDATTADSFFRGGAGSPFGTTAATAWNNDMPWGVYIVDTFTGPCIAVSRRMNLSAAPAPNLIGYKDNPPAFSSIDNLFFGSTTAPVITSGGCWLIAIVNVRKSNLDDWTFQNPGTDGTFGIFNFKKLNQSYSMPTGQNGAAAGSYFVVPAGTAPTYIALSYVSYYARLDGSFEVVSEHVNVAGGTPGAGGGAIAMALPFPARFGASGIPAGRFTTVNNTNGTGGDCILSLSNPYLVAFEYQTTIATTKTFLTGADQNNATRSINLQLKLL